MLYLEPGDVIRYFKTAHTIKSIDLVKREVHVLPSSSWADPHEPEVWSLDELLEDLTNMSAWIPGRADPELPKRMLLKSLILEE